MSKLKAFVENPYLNVIVGIIFLLSGISEVINELDDLESITFGSHHGVIIYSIFHILKTLPDIFEGLEYVEKANS